MHCLCKTLLWNKRHDVICHVTPNAIVCFSYFWWLLKHICRCKWPRVKWESKECVLWCPGPIDPVLRHQDQYQNVCVATFYILNLWLWNLTERNLIYLVRIKLSPNVVQGIIKQAGDCFIEKLQNVLCDPNKPEGIPGDGWDLAATRVPQKNLSHCCWHQMAHQDERNLGQRTLEMSLLREIEGVLFRCVYPVINGQWTIAQQRKSQHFSLITSLL